MEKFKELVSLCKSSVRISVNEHKDYHESVEQHINEENIKDIDIEIFEQMINRDIIIRVQAYPDTPSGFFLVYHYDIDEAIDIALEAVKNNR